VIDNLEMSPAKPTESTALPTPLPPAGPTAFTIGFLTLLSDPSGVVGGYLLTNAWGRPLEFRMSTAVQPNRVQQILYGPTLTEYLHTDLIGKTLIEKTALAPALLVTDSVHALALRSRLNVPTLVIDATESVGLIKLSHARASVALAYSSRFASDRAAIEERLERVDPAVDLAEPFTRIREAVVEARKMGVTTRAA